MKRRREALTRVLEPNRDEMALFTMELIRIPSENPPGQLYKECLGAIADKLRSFGVHSEIRPVPGGEEERDNPRCWLKARLGDGGPRVYFHGHADVVPAQSPEQFEPALTEDTIVGRGSSDMKGGITSMVYAMHAMKESGLPEKGSVVLQIVPDEETGGQLGSRALSKDGTLVEEDTVAMFTAEPTGGLVWHASRGAITLRVTVKGRPSHVGLQFRGVNAFERMLLVADALRQLKEEVEGRVTAFPIEPAPARRSILMMGGEVAGGDNFNLVPDRCTFTIDRRLNPEEDLDKERQRLSDIVDTVRSDGVEIDVETIQEARPAGVSEDHPAARALGKSIEMVTGEPARFELCPGILETRFYAEHSVPAFAYGPGLLSVSHGPNEFIKRGDMELCALTYALTAARLLETAAIHGPLDG